MTPNFSRIMRWFGFGLVVLAALVVLFINRNLAGLADWAWPGAGLYTHLGLLVVEAVALLWFWRGIFGGHKHLLLMEEADPEALADFAREFERRMRSNPYLRSLDLDPTAADFHEQGLIALRDRADEEIRNTAKRIFLATALSQNGRIDALIVFVSLCRLVWRISRLYNQRPHPREILSLYWAVVTSTFLALSLEELDISTEITIGFTETFQAMAPAGMTASVPFAGRALQTFTTSTIDGAANCYLALRAGIITRNAYAYRANGENPPSRGAVFKEAGGILLSMSNDLVSRLAATMVSTLASAAKYAGGTTLAVGRGIADGIGKAGSGVGSAAGKLADGTVDAVKKTGTAAYNVSRDACSLAADGVKTVGKGAEHAGRGIGRGVSAVGRGIGRAGKAVISPFRRRPKA